jgi:hypothetical protein
MTSIPYSPALAFDDGPLGLGEWDAGADSAPIPPRGWLLGTIFCRRFVSSLIADGGTGKTALRYVQLLELATGQSLIGDHVFERCRVLIVSLEDGADELRRRILAAMLRHRIDRETLKGWLFLAAPGASAGKLMLLDDHGRIARGELAGKIEQAVIDHKIDLISLDPFVKSHGVEENGNNGIDAVMQVLTDIAVKYDVAIDVPHHAAKGTADPGNANRGRGASAMKDAARLVYTLSPMTPEEAVAFNLPEEERRRLVRLDSAKVNITPPLSAARWFRLVGVTLGNTSDLYPHGDEVQTIEEWTPPDTWAGLSHRVLNQILTDIDAGLPDGNLYSDGPNVTDRAAWRVVAKHAPEKSEAAARQIVKTWVRTGVLRHHEYANPITRKPVKGLRVDPAKRPS